MYVYIIAGIFLLDMVVYIIPLDLFYKYIWKEKIIENLILLYSNTKKVVAVSFSLVGSILFFHLNFSFVFFAHFFFDREE